MKLVIVSDSHGSTDSVLKVVRHEKPDMLIHLGDLEDSRATVEAGLPSPLMPCVFIKGNCDYSSQGDLSGMSVFSLKGHRFLCTHGHLQHVNYGLDNLLYTAEENKCDIALYGHTHAPFDEFLEVPFTGRKIHVLNPGSIARPRGGSQKSYIVMTIKDDGAYEVLFKNP